MAMKRRQPYVAWRNNLRNEMKSAASVSAVMAAWQRRNEMAWRQSWQANRGGEKIANETKSERKKSLSHRKKDVSVMVISAAIMAAKYVSASA
jgi:hypothetical protein